MSKPIPLTRGYAAIVDDEDYDELNSWKWCANVKEYGVYAYRTELRCPGGPKTSIYMHRQILGILGAKGIEGDHCSGDTLDNRRANLRVATRAQNATNQGVRSDNTTGVRGVDYVKKNGHYRARVYLNGVEVVIGYANTLEEARALRERAQQEFYGEFARTPITRARKEGKG